MAYSHSGKHWEFHDEHSGSTAPFNFESGNAEVTKAFYKHMQPFVYDFCKHVAHTIDAYKFKSIVCKNDFGSNWLTKNLKEVNKWHSGVIKFNDLDICFSFGMMVFNTYSLYVRCAIEVEY